MGKTGIAYRKIRNPVLIGGLSEQGGRGGVQHDRDVRVQLQDGRRALRIHRPLDHIFDRLGLIRPGGNNQDGPAFMIDPIPMVSA